MIKHTAMSVLAVMTLHAQKIRQFAFLILASSTQCSAEYASSLVDQMHLLAHLTLSKPAASGNDSDLGDCQ